MSDAICVHKGGPIDAHLDHDSGTSSDGELENLAHRNSGDDDRVASWSDVNSCLQDVHNAHSQELIVLIHILDIKLRSHNEEKFLSMRNIVTIGDTEASSIVVTFLCDLIQ